MKKYIVALVLLITLSIVSCETGKASDKINQDNLKSAQERDAKAANLPVVEWDKTEHDFGAITQGELVETTFVLTNVGKSDLIIAKAKGSCGCTVPEWPRTPVKPGESADIVVKFNSKNKKDNASNTVTLSTNTKSTSEVIRIKAFVEVPEK